MPLERLIETLVKELKLGAVPQKDKKGFYHLKINPLITVFFHEIPDGVYMRSTVCPTLKKNNLEDLYIYLMKANLLGQGTGGAAIGIDPEENFFVLSQTINQEPTYLLFKETVEDFVNYVDYWREGIESFEKETII